MTNHDIIMTQPEDKGKQGGKCNRTACWNRPAICWSSVERAFYCVTCAKEINKYLPRGVSPITIPPEVTTTDFRRDVFDGS